MSECYSFVVNGVPCSTEEEKPLLRYLRDELRLTSVKDGCSEGACGTCTILVDGKAVKACVLSTKRAAGKEIVTVEGLSEAEREAFVYAFGAVGAVQCGFCIPGMVMAGKALLDQNPNPSEAEIKKAIRGNVCRCTGYKKIIEGIALAGAILRGEASVDPALEEGEDYGVGRGPSAPTCATRCWAGGSTATICTWTAWRTPPPSAPSTPEPGCWTSTPPPLWLCRGCWPSSPPTTCPTTRWATSSRTGT